MLCRAVWLSVKTAKAVDLMDLISFFLNGYSLINYILFSLGCTTL